MNEIETDYQTFTTINQLRRAVDKIPPRPKILCRNKQEAQRQIVLVAMNTPIEKLPPFGSLDAFEWIESEQVPEGELFIVQEPSEAQKFAQMRSVQFTSRDTEPRINL